MQSFFIWNNKDCRSMGVIMRSPAPIIRPEERVKHVELPGVAGDLTETEGEDIYNPYIQTISISVRGAYNVRNVLKWLRGSGYVTFSGEPDRRQKARIIGAITLDKVSRNIDHWAGEVQIYCQPLKELLQEAAATITATGAAVRNAGDVKAAPVWHVKASGTSFSLMVAGEGMTENNTIAVTGTTNNHIYRIDSASMEIIDENNGNSVTKNSTGHFPLLAPGANTITGSGWSKIEIDKRERYL